jgi:hypothetical protein
LRVIPTEPGFVPSSGVQEAALQLLRSWLPAAEDITSELSAETRFIDPGANLEHVECPVCGADLFGWWQDAMDEASRQDFATLEIVVPCCQTNTTLNDLRYTWPAGFARFVAEVRNPGRGGLLTGDEIRQLEQALGCELRQVLAHY